MIRLLEELSLNAWPALQTHLYDGWILRFGNGYTKRANSVNPLYPSSINLLEKIEWCERLYRERGIPPVFKLTKISRPDTLDEELARRGYVSDSSTSVQLLSLTGGSWSLASGLTLYETVDEEWFAAFCHMSRTPEQQHYTVRRQLELLPPRHALALVRVGSVPIACGLGVVQNEFLGLFDVVVDASHWREGFGYRVMESLLEWGRSCGAHTAYLQVLLTNLPALRLYDRLGFREHYRYWYRIRR